MKRDAAYPVDASALLAALLSFVPADDARVQATVQRVERELAAGALDLADAEARCAARLDDLRRHGPWAAATSLFEVVGGADTTG